MPQDYAALADQARAEARAFKTGRGREIRAAPTLIERATDALPIIGATVGGIAGLAAGGVGAAGGVALGAAGGEGFRQAIRSLQGRSVPRTMSGQLWRIGGQGVGHGVSEGVFRGAGNLIRRGARFSMDAALRPGLRVMSESGRPITGPTETLSDQFRNVDITGEALTRKIPIRNKGLVRTQRELEVARGRAIAAVEDFAASRPRVAGLLPEGRTPIPLGDIPVPAGGRPSLSPSRAIQRVPFNQQRARQGLSETPAVTQFYGGQPAKTAVPAVADVVEGPGVVLLPRRSSPPAEPLIPGQSQMIGIEEAMMPARRALMTQQQTDLPRNIKKSGELIREYEDAFPNPIDVVQGQGRKETAQEAASRLFRTGRGTAQARFEQKRAEGYQQAIERRLPTIRALNQETQRQLALRETLLKALNTEAQSRRFTLSGALDNPRLWGAVAHGLRRTAPAVEWTPQAGRAAFLALMASHAKARRKQPEP